MVAVSELVFGLDAELVRLGYKASTMAWYRGCWRRLQRFFASRGVQEFSLDRLHRTSSPLTYPNGTKTPNCSTGSPTSNQAALNYAQRSTAAALLASGKRRALRITQRCS